jgi:hypothetical protein
MPWTGPFQLRSYLDQQGAATPLPPEDPGVYVVTELSWNGDPSVSAGVLWVGASGVRTPQSKAGLRGRIGNLVSSLCGFHGGYAGLHAGGVSISQSHCLASPGHSPLEVFIAWRVMHRAPPAADR